MCWALRLYPKLAYSGLAYHSRLTSFELQTGSQNFAGNFVSRRSGWLWLNFQFTFSSSQTWAFKESQFLTLNGLSALWATQHSIVIHSTVPFTPRVFGSLPLGHASAWTFLASNLQPIARIQLSCQHKELFSRPSSWSLCFQFLSRSLCRHSDPQASFESHSKFARVTPF